MLKYKCIDCGQEYESELKACPNCGCPTEYQSIQVEQNQQESPLQDNTFAKRIIIESGKCPFCGAPFSVDDSINDTMVCSYCGNRTSINSLLEGIDSQPNKTHLVDSSLLSKGSKEGEQYTLAENTLKRYSVSPPFKENFQVTDTNGPMGECLFPTNSDGQIIFQGVIKVPCSKAELKEYAIRFFKELGKNPAINVKTIQTEYESRYDFDVILSSGKVGQEYYYVKWHRDRSRIRCHVALEFKEGRYRYTVNPYETNRLNIRGEAKCDGTPNEIHWQRVNSLKKRKASQDLIKNEIEAYESEYNAVINFVNLLANYYNEMHQESDF